MCIPALPMLEPAHLLELLWGLGLGPGVQACAPRTRLHTPAQAMWAIPSPTGHVGSPLPNTATWAALPLIGHVSSLVPNTRPFGQPPPAPLATLHPLPGTSHTGTPPPHQTMWASAFTTLGHSGTDTDVNQYQKMGYWVTQLPWG